MLRHSPWGADSTLNVRVAIIMTIVFEFLSLQASMSSSPVSESPGRGKKSSRSGKGLLSSLGVGRKKS